MFKLSENRSKINLFHVFALKEHFNKITAPLSLFLQFEKTKINHVKYQVRDFSRKIRMNVKEKFYECPRVNTELLSVEMINRHASVISPVSEIVVVGPSSKKTLMSCSTFLAVR